MNDQQRAAMQKAVDWIDWYTTPGGDSPGYSIYEVARTLREALAQHPMDYDQGFVDGVEEGLAMAEPQLAQDGRVAKTIFTLEDVQKAAEMGRAAGIAEAEALAQPQGEWVDLTDDEINTVVRESFDRSGSTNFRIVKNTIAKFKEKNTPPIVPQGEPVAWAHPSGGYLSARYTKEFATGLEKETYTIPLYAAPVRTKDLNDDELREVLDKHCGDGLMPLSRAIIAADRSKNK